MTIEFVNASNVELIKHNASDVDVAMAAWVSNFNKENLPVTTPSEWDIKYCSDYLQGGNIEYANKYYPETVEYLDRVKGLINFLYRERHMSPFEHGSFTFYIDTPIFVAREFMRHRTFSYNETSGRYKELEPRFYVIDSDRPVVQKGKVGAYRFDQGTDEQYGSVFANTTEAYRKSWNSYQAMLSDGVAKEVARNVLPVGTMTQFYATANPRNLMQFFMLRNDPNALEEIRIVAASMEKMFSEAMPLTYAAFLKYDWRDDKSELEELRKKVAQLEAEKTYEENILHSKKNDYTITVSNPQNTERLPDVLNSITTGFHR